MNSPYASILLIAVLVLLMYFVVLRPQRKRQQAQAETMRTLEPGTRVMLTSGIYATIVYVGEKQIVLETSPGVELTVLKQAVAKVVPPGEEDADVPAELEADDNDQFDSQFDAQDDFADQNAQGTQGPDGYQPDQFDADGETVRTAGTEASTGPQEGAVSRSAFEQSTSPSWPPADRTGDSDPAAPSESSSEGLGQHNQDAENTNPSSTSSTTPKE